MIKIGNKNFGLRNLIIIKHYDIPRRDFINNLYKTLLFIVKKTEINKREQY